MASILQMVEGWTSRHPDKLLFSFVDVNGCVVESYSYASFLQRIDVIASHLNRWGRLESGSRVLLVYDAGLELIAALFACARIGLIPVPTAPPTAYGSRAALYRMEHIARDCQAAALLTSGRCGDLLRRGINQQRSTGSKEHAGAIDSIDWIVTEMFVEPAGAVSPQTPSDVFFLQYTSGSTSSPKGVVVTQDNVIHNCALVVDHEAPVAVSWLPQHHDMGLLGYYIYILLSGGTTYGFSPTSFVQRPALWLETITKYGGTGSSAPNFAYEYCLRPDRISDAILSGVDLSTLRFLMAAAEPIKPDTYRRFLQRFERHGLKPESFFVAYGLAENTLAVTNYGRRTIALNGRMLARGLVRRVRDASDVSAATHLMSCGTPLGDNEVRIVEPETHVALGDKQIGEIWVTGRSKCRGYWGNLDLTRDAFHAKIEGDGELKYLRTGDMGFFAAGELYVCGRRKDLIIVRGQNYYPQDIETVVEQASPLIRNGCVAAFELNGDREASVGVVAEIASRKALPDTHAIASAIRHSLNLEVDLIALVPPKAVPKTSSGKLMRHMAKQQWLAGEFNVLDKFIRVRDTDGAAPDGNSSWSPFEYLKREYGLSGNEPYSLVEAGLDSIDLVTFMHELKEALQACGDIRLGDQVDIRLIQHVSISEIFRLIDHLERMSAAAIVKFQHLLKEAKEVHLAEELAKMEADRALPFTPPTPTGTSAERPDSIFLTGGTGFLGPFLLKSLLEQTDAKVYVLVRATTAEHARHRLRTALNAVVGSEPVELERFEQRVVPVCGDLEKPALGLDPAAWHRLADGVDAIYHNGALVNYLLPYEAMRAANIGGTNEALRLAFDGRPKAFNHISTTFIFGWATKNILNEVDCNADMELLDFGYSQSKWVSERLVALAARHGLETRIFRPALITPTTSGDGASFDITMRLLAFMIKHGIGVDTLNQVSFVPADVTANNIVAIANLPDTAGGAFHVTRDDYANMVDITNIITALTGRRFELFKLKEFVPEVVRRCTRDDLLFPLLDFLIGSIDNISAMEFKRYDSSAYQCARDGSPHGVPDPSLRDTVSGILLFMGKQGIVDKTSLQPIE